MVTELRPWQEQNYYEILEVDPHATEEEIRVAYEKLKAIYSYGTAGMTILFTPEEVKQIHDMIEEAYRVLRDPRSQREYDLMLRGELDKPVVPPAVPIAPHRVLDQKQVGEALAADEITWSGESLRKIRRYLSLDLDAMAVETKIAKHNLKAIEEEDVHALPAPVYLKGFLKTYARALGLEAYRVAEEYLAKIPLKDQKEG